MLSLHISQSLYRVEKTGDQNTLKVGRLCVFSVGCMSIWPIGAFPTKYVWERSPMTDFNADSAHCKHLLSINYRSRAIRTKVFIMEQISPFSVSLQNHTLFQENATRASRLEHQMCYHIQEDKAFCQELSVMTFKI